MAAGVAPESCEAEAVLQRLLPGADRARRRVVADQLATFTDDRVDRYWQLVGVINAWPAFPSPAPAFRWLIRALRAPRTRCRGRDLVPGPSTHRQSARGAGLSCTCRSVGPVPGVAGQLAGGRPRASGDVIVLLVGVVVGQSGHAVGAPGTGKSGCPRRRRARHLWPGTAATEIGPTRRRR